jgi:hypothetical protein
MSSPPKWLIRVRGGYRLGAATRDILTLVVLAITIALTTCRSVRKYHRQARACAEGAWTVNPPLEVYFVVICLILEKVLKYIIYKKS